MTHDPSTMDLHRNQVEKLMNADLSDWESDFINSLDCRLNDQDKPLTDNQAEILSRIWHKNN